MRPEHIDRRLADLHQASERISANLVDLEIDSGRQLLEATRLQGQSAIRWAAASQALTELWRRHGLLESLLTRADGLRRSGGRYPRTKGELPRSDEGRLQSLRRRLFRRNDADQ